jgi:hypothetical protein
MNLKQPFFKIPMLLDITEAATEVVQHLKESDWIDHPSSFAGNYYIPLTSYNGTINNLKKTPVKPTLFSEQLPAVTHLLKSFNLTIGISRLMRLKAGHDVPIHSDTNEYWDKRVRIHIPLITSNKVFFTCGNEEVIMSAGEVWTFNNWIKHGVRNEGTHDRIHLVFDTEAKYIFDSEGNLVNELEGNVESNELTLEKTPTPALKSGAELEASLFILIQELQSQGSKGKDEIGACLTLIHDHIKRWNAIEAEFGLGIGALPKYQEAIKSALEAADGLSDTLRIRANEAKIKLIFKTRVADAMNLQMLFSNEK